MGKISKLKTECADGKEETRILTQETSQVINIQTVKLMLHGGVGKSKIEGMGIKNMANPCSLKPCFR